MPVDFDGLADVYERLVDWPKRLENETPFYRRLFDSVEARTVLDAACGTGQHAAMFHSWGLVVEGADIDPSMIDRAKSNFGQNAGLRWAVRGFDQRVEIAESFDVAVCVGNSLALAPDIEMVERAIHQMVRAVRRGGLLILHVMNLWRLPDGPCIWQRCLRATLKSGDALILKGVHRSKSRGFVDLVVSRWHDARILVEKSVPLLGLDAAGLAQMASDAGADRIKLFGGYHDEPYDRGVSVDIVVVATK